MLISLWASWCRNCVAELKELGQRQSELQEAEIDVVAVCTNGLGEDTTSMKPAIKLLYSMEFPFCATTLDPKLYELLKAVQDSFIPMAGPLPLPCSFLIDGKGRLAAIYRGPVSVDDILADAQFSDAQFSDELFSEEQFSEDGSQESFEWSALLPGRSLNLPTDSDPGRHAAAGHHFNLGKAAPGCRLLLHCNGALPPHFGNGLRHVFRPQQPGNDPPHLQSQRRSHLPLSSCD